MGKKHRLSTKELKGHHYQSINKQVIKIKGGDYNFHKQEISLLQLHKQILELKELLLSHEHEIKKLKRKLKQYE